MLAYMIPTSSADKILAPRQRRPHPTLTAAATSRNPLTRKKKHSHMYLPTRISSQANEQHRKSHLTTQLPCAKHAHSQTPGELQILPSGETQIARKQRKKKQQDEEAARRQTLTRGRVTRPDHSTNYG
jgi:hypothetical protein